MKTFSQAALGKILAPLQTAEVENTKTAPSYSNSGPNYFDWWKYEMEGNQAFLQSNTNQQTTPTKTPVIFSCDILCKFEPTDIEIDFVISALDHYNFYFFAGDKCNFIDYKKTKDGDEFWENRFSMVGATKASVETTLIQQGISTQNLIIIDNEEYANVFTRLYDYCNEHIKIFEVDPNNIYFNNSELPLLQDKKKLYLASDSIDLTRYNILDPNFETEIKKTFNPNNIKRVIVHSIHEKEMMIVRNLFPHLETVECENGWNPQNKEYHGAVEKVLYGLNVIFNYSATCEAICISTVINVKGFTLRSHNSLQNLSLDAQNLVTLTVEDCSVFTNFEVKASDSLQELNLINCHNLSDLFGQAQPLKLKKVRIVNTQLAANMISFFIVNPLLESLELTNCVDIQQLSLKSYTALKELTLKHFSNLFSLDLGNPTVLKKFKLVGAHRLTAQNIETELQKCTALEELELRLHSIPVNFSIKTPTLKKLILTNYAAESIDLTDFPQLEELFLFSCENLQTIILSPAQNLKKLIIEDCNNLQNLDFSNCTQLKAISLVRLSKLKQMNFAGCQQLKILRIENCNELNTLDLNACTNLESLEIIIAQNLSTILCRSPKLVRKNVRPLFKKDLNSRNDYYAGFIECNTIGNNIPIESLKKKYPNIKIWHYSYTTIDSENINYHASYSGITGFVIYNCSNSNKFLNFSSLPLKTLTVHASDNGTSNFECIYLQYCSQLQSLCLDNLFELVDLDLRGCTQLKTLVISNCYKLQNIKLPSQGKLEFIFIKNSKVNIKMNQLPQLKTVIMKGGNKIEIEECPALETIKLQAGMEVSLNLESSKNLQSLSINCGQLKIHALDQCSHVRYVTLISSNTLAYSRQTPVLCDTTIVDTDTQTNDTPGNYLLNYSQLSQERSLRQHNENSPVCLFNFSSQSELDGNTKLDLSPKCYSGNFSVTFTAKQAVNRDKYRIFIHDAVRYEKGKLIFYTTPYSLDKEIPVSNKSFDNNTVTKLNNEAKSTDEYAVGYFTGTLPANTPFPLPTDGAIGENDIVEMYVDTPKKIKLFWDTKKQQHVILATNKRKPQSIKILYKTKRNPTYDAKNYTHFTQVDPSVELLPKVIREKLLARIKALPKTHELYNIFDETNGLSLDQHAQRAIQYCNHPPFTNKALSILPTDGLDLSWQILYEQKGACRHSAESLFLCLRLLGIKINNSNNPDHSIDEGICGPDQRLQAMDTGGAPVVDLTPKEARQNIFEGLPITIAVAPAPRVKTIEDEWEEIYYKELKKLACQDELTSVEELFANKDPRQPMLLLNKQQNPWAVHQKISDYLRVTHPEIFKNKFLLINSADEFMRYLHPRQLADGTTTILNEGPLTDLILKGGVLVINWGGDFTAEQIASFKSILEPYLENDPVTRPTLFTQSVSPNLRIISIVTPKTQTCSATLSRGQRFTIGEKFMRSEVRSETVATMEIDTPTREVMEVDVCAQSNWRTKVLGKIQVKGKRKDLKEGKLPTILKKTKCSLTVINPPENDKDFALLKHRLGSESQMFYNGTSVPIPAGFEMKSVQRNYNRKLPKVIFRAEKPEDAARSRIYLGQYNFYECFGNLLIDNVTHEGIPTQGLLEEYKEGVDIFYITQKIPSNAMQALEKKIEKKYPHKNFEFVLSPLALENPIVPTILTAENFAQEHMKYSVFASTDSYFLTKQLGEIHKASNPLIIDIRPNTNFSDLIYETRTDKDGFHCDTKAALNALCQGRTVIINGQISATLYQQLLPYLSLKQITINKQPINITGKLILVAPGIILKNYKVMNAATYVYQPQDYLNQFPTDKDLLEKISLFHQFAEKFIQNSNDTNNSITYYRLANMLRHIKTGKLHKNNPIKGLFHFDYPLESNEYAFLNVLAKYLFVTNAVTSPEYNHKKLLQLIEREKIVDKASVKNHIWSILNCFNGLALCELLGNDFSSLFESSQPPLKVREEIIEKIWQVISQPIVCQQKPASIQTREQKQLDQLQTLLNDDGTNIIVLKGPPGVGKSHTMRTSEELLKFKCCEGRNAILEFLTCTDTSTVVLLLDEANMEDPGTHEFLRGITRDQKGIYYRGKYYSFTSTEPNIKRKIIATCNFENNPGRYHHQLFQYYSETMVFKKADDDFLIKNILKPILGELLEKYIKDLLAVYHLIPTYQPFFCYSNRDVENLAVRFKVLAENCGTEPEQKKALFDACCGEFAGMIFEKEKRQKFINELAMKWNIALPPVTQKLIQITPKHFISSEKEYVINALRQDLLIRERILKNNYPYPHKICTLIEGGSGDGKSTLIKDILEQAGFSENATDLSKKFTQVNAGTPEALKVLEQAAAEGSIVILDEFNLDTFDKKTEKLLNKLLTGYDEDGKKVNIKPGFRVYGSQNNSTMAGRSISLPLRDRVHFIYMDPFTDGEMQSLAVDAKTNKLVPYPAAFTKAFNKVKKEYPQTTNMRTYRNGLQFINFTALANDFNNNNDNMDATKTTRSKHPRMTHTTDINNNNNNNLGTPKKHKKS